MTVQNLILWKKEIDIWFSVESDPNYPILLLTGTMQLVKLMMLINVG
jgi:general stress protein 26